MISLKDSNLKQSIKPAVVYKPLKLSTTQNDFNTAANTIPTIITTANNANGGNMSLPTTPNNNNNAYTPQITFNLKRSGGLSRDSSQAKIEKKNVKGGEFSKSPVKKFELLLEKTKLTPNTTTTTTTNTANTTITALSSNINTTRGDSTKRKNIKTLIQNSMCRLDTRNVSQSTQHLDLTQIKQCQSIPTLMTDIQTLQQQQTLATSCTLKDLNIKMEIEAEKKKMKGDPKAQQHHLMTEQKKSPSPRNSTNKENFEDSTKVLLIKWKDALEEASREKNEWKTRVEQLKSNMKDTKDKLNELNQNMKNYKANSVRLTMDNQHLEKEHVENEKEINKLKTEIKALQDWLDETHKKDNENQNKIRLENKCIKALSDNILTLKLMISHETDAKEKIKENVINLKKVVHKLKTTHDGYEAEKTHFMKQIESDLKHIDD